MNTNKDMVLVEWYDARFFPGTYNEKTIKHHKMCLFNSLGYLISKDKTTTILAAECNDEKDYRDITLIPTRSIISIKKLLLVPPV
jgi:hypothetical protein